MKMKVKSFSPVWLFATPWTEGYQAPPSMGFSRQEYWSGLPFTSPGDLPDPGIKPRSPAFQADPLTSEPQTTTTSCWKAQDSSKDYPPDWIVVAADQDAGDWSDTPWKSSSFKNWHFPMNFYGHIKFSDDTKLWLWSHIYSHDINWERVSN